MGINKKLKKGFDINILGTSQQTTESKFASRTFSVKPTDFFGLSPIPKVVPEIGQEVLAGDALFFDKKNPDVLFTAPVSGEVVEVIRGPKRRIDEIVILADSEIKFRNFDKLNVSSSNRADIVKLMLESGAWAFLRQRPFNVIANHKETPRDIFISGFDSSPLASDLSYTLKGESSSFQAGIDVLNKLTSGKVHLTVSSATSNTDTFRDAKGVELHVINGAHPAGCVGVQIHNIAPIVKGDIVWTINPQDVLALGRLFSEGKFDTSRLIALGGPEVSEPKYYRTYLGANVEGMLKDNLSNDHVRVISGSPLVGTTINQNGHVGFYDQHISVLDEGDRYELFGWLLPRYARPSLSRTFPSFLTPKKEFKVNTNSHGEHRAMVVTGSYEKVTPMDIYPMQLLKSILYKDFDQMEGLGIYEVVEEDLALCGFVCPSKTNVQEILRDGLDYMREQA